MFNFDLPLMILMSFLWQFEFYDEWHFYAATVTTTIIPFAILILSSVYIWILLKRRNDNTNNIQMSIIESNLDPQNLDAIG